MKKTSKPSWTHLSWIDNTVPVVSSAILSKFSYDLKHWLPIISEVGSHYFPSMLLCGINDTVVLKDWQVAKLPCNAFKERRIQMQKQIMSLPRWCSELVPEVSDWKMKISTKSKGWLKAEGWRNEALQLWQSLHVFVVSKWVLGCLSKTRNTELGISHVLSQQPPSCCNSVVSSCCHSSWLQN